MDDTQDTFYEDNFLLKLEVEIGELSKIIDKNMGTRIGQSTVCSQKMHTFHPSKPQEVTIWQDIDAGEIFYHRKDPGTIYHLDVFHEWGLVDHYIVASQVCRAVEEYNSYNATHPINHRYGDVDLNFFDVQTGTGGGRITGKLNCGKKISLRKSHTNHVHLAVALSKQQLACLIYVVMAVESAVLSCGLELRCNEKVENVKGSSKGKMDLSAYREKSDSLLQENNSNEGFEPYQKGEETTNFMDNFETGQELKEFLTKREDDQNSPQPRSGINSIRPSSCLMKDGMIELHGRDENTIKLKELVKNQWEKYLSDIESHLRKVMGRAKKIFPQNGRSELLENKSSWSNSKSIVNHMKVSVEPKELELSHTVQAAARRMVEEQVSLFKITSADLRYTVHKKRQRMEFCLLIDASSSMEGQRIQAAKLLAKFLFFSTADPMSIIAFQGNRSWVQVPFTRDIGQLERGLETIKAYGETPLALGLTACLQYFQKNHVHNPFIVLITDGVPTLGMITTDPVHDALQVAQSIKVKKYGFTCIGLKPHLDYLKQLAKVAGGTIYVVDELEKEGMC